MLKEFIILLLVAVVLLFVVSWFAIEKHEKLECLKWQREARIYTNYYFTDWQIQQCQHYGVELKLK